MSTPPETHSTARTSSNRRNRWLAGVALIAIGLLVLAGQVVNVGALALLFLPALGVIFLLWGIGARTVGLMIPGGILLGIGLGIYLAGGPLSYLGDPAKGAAFLISFALGWAIITLLSALFADRTHWWPLVVGGILALIGAATMAGGVALDVLGWVGRLWPLGLIALG